MRCMNVIARSRRRRGTPPILVAGTAVIATPQPAIRGRGQDAGEVVSSFLRPFLKAFAPLLLAALFLPTVARTADSAPDSGPAGAAPPAWQFNAGTRTLRATGAAVIRRDDPNAIPQAYAEAENRARMDAVAVLTAYVYGIETPSGTVGYIVGQDPGKKTIVDSYIQGAKLLEKRYLPEGRLEVEVELNLTGLDKILTP